MEDLNKDIKKPEKETPKVPEKTLGDVKKEVIQEAEEDMSWVSYNTENIKNYLKGFDGPETVIIDDENQKVADNADREFKMLKNEVNENIFEKSIPQQLIKLQKEAEIVKSSDAGLQNKYKSINDIFGQMTEITKNCSDEYYKDHRSEFSDTGDFISEIRNNLEYKLIDEFNKGFVLDKENAMAVKASNKSYAEKIEYLQTLINLLHMKETNNENLDILNRQNSLKMSLAETKRFLEAIRDEIMKKMKLREDIVNPSTDSEDKLNDFKKWQNQNDLNWEKNASHEELENKIIELEKRKNEIIKLMEDFKGKEYARELQNEYDEMDQKISKLKNQLNIRKNEPGTVLDKEPSSNETPEPEGITIDDIWNKLSNNEKVTDEEIIFIMLKIRSIDAEENGELTEDESKIFQIAQEMEKRGYALTDKSAEKLINDFEKKTKAEIGEAIEADEDSKKYNEKDQKGKEAEISDKKNKLEGEIKGEGIEIGRNIDEMEEQMKNIKKDLEEKFKSYLGMEKELSRICAVEGILEQKDKEELINVFKLLKNIYKGTLNTDKISFLAETLKENKFDPNNPDALINTYNQRNYNIKRLEETISSLDVEIEKLEKGEEEAFSRMIDWIKSHPKEIALVAGVAGGVILAPFIAKALAGAGVGLALETGIPLAAKGALVGAKAISLSLLKVGGIAAILAGLLLNGEKIDDFMESITGKKIPSWASWGLKKKGERK